MHPKERLQEDLKTAMKSGDTQRRDALRLLTSVLKQAEIDGRVPITEEQALSLLQTEAKKRRETIAENVKIGRDEVVAQETFELTLIESYLPQQLSRDEVEAIVKDVIAETGVTSAKEIGVVMKALMPKVKGLADGKLVNDVVKALLG